MKIHEPGNCVDPAYGNPWCDGEGRFAPDPYAEELADDHTFVWMCDGQRAGRAADV
jgi:hypothetical protein